MSNRVERPFFHFDQREDGQWDIKCAEFIGEDDELVLTQTIMPDEVVQAMLHEAGVVLDAILQEIAQDRQSRRMDL